MPRNLSLTFVLALCTMMGALGIDTYLPSFHAIAQEFAVGPAAVQQTLIERVRAAQGADRRHGRRREEHALLGPGPGHHPSRHRPPTTPLPVISEQKQAVDSPAAVMSLACATGSLGA